MVSLWVNFGKKKETLELIGFRQDFNMGMVIRLMLMIFLKVQKLSLQHRCLCLTANGSGIADVRVKGFNKGVNKRWHI